MSDAQGGLLCIPVRRSVARPEFFPWTHQLVRPFGLLSVKGSQGGDRPRGSLRRPSPPPVLLCYEYWQDLRRHGADRDSRAQALVNVPLGLDQRQKSVIFLSEGALACRSMSMGVKRGIALKLN